MAPHTTSLQNVWSLQGPEIAYRLTVEDPTRVTLRVSGLTENLDVVVIKETAGQYCDPALGCFAYGNAPLGQDEVVTFAAYPTMAYYVIVDGRSGAVSAFDLTVSCDATGFEDCGSAQDEDLDGLVGCDDPECMGVSPHCVP